MGIFIIILRAVMFFSNDDHSNYPGD